MSRPQAGSIERRSFAGELRTAADSKFELTGYAASFNTLSKDLGGYRERLAVGCFKRSLDAGGDVKALFNHDKNIVLGRLENKTLSVTEDARGLKFRVQLNPASQQHRDIYESVKRGDVSECSFAFCVHDGNEDWDESKDESGNRFIRRTIRDCDLMDVSVVTHPAYSENNATSVQARSHVADYVPTMPDACFWGKATKRAQEIREEIFRAADAFIVNEKTFEVTPVFYTEAEKSAALDRQLRARADEIGREIFNESMRENLGLDLD